jgi:methionyl-tRNA formyltransferase
MVEGCLSFPGIEIIANRPKEVIVTGLDRYGKPVELSANGLFARVLQHEIDHLNSTLLIDHIKELEVVFIGTGTLGSPTLEALAMDPQYNVKLVVTGGSKSISRDHHKKTNPIEQIALKYNLPLLKTKNINDKSIIEEIKKTKCQMAIMADFGQILGKEILTIFKFGIINIHPSLLPRHRGPSPVQQTILDGDKITGVSLILTGEKMDAGKIISQVSVELRGTETATILKNYLAEVGASLLLNSIPYYLTGDLEPVEQDEAKSTYNRLFNKEDGRVDQRTPKEIVDRKVRAFSDWPHAYITINNKRVQLISGHFEKDGTYLLDRVKPEGKNEITYDDYKRGYRTELTFY